ncbi:nucleoside diphosphate-linked moiety X motif 19 isoform X1 [Ixodes scapularis]|nr:nucleoside diphosphate-linked moiety X motif 19 isoform X1 [Ixodes scapularis]
MATSVSRCVWRSGSNGSLLVKCAGFAFSGRCLSDFRWVSSSSVVFATKSSLMNRKRDVPYLYRESSHTAMSAPPWKEAASLIVVSRAPLRDVVGRDLASAMIATVWNNQSKQRVSRCDYRVLMVKRSSLSSFMANAYVYPGGLCERCDFSADWWDVFEAAGASRESLLRDVCGRTLGPRPPMIEKPITLSHQNLRPEDHLPGDLAYRISAIRETFEETGVLLLTKAPRASCSVTTEAVSEGFDATQWRQRLREDPANFAKICREVGLCPNVWALHEWWDWLTPISVGHRRYDTMFYLCCLDKQPEVVLDQSEVITLKWCTPEGMLEDYSTGAVFLAPPQVYETSRLLNMSSFSALSEFACSRAVEGCEQWMPVIASANDGAVSLLPGDDLYPDDPDYYGRGPGPEYPFNLEELRKRCQNLHRMEVQGPLCTAFCNITPPKGHLQPLTFKGPPSLVPSML